MAKLKGLLPSLRERKRYVAFEILSEKRQENARRVREAIDQALLTHAGVRTCAEAGAQFLTDQYQHQRGLVRINHKHVDTLKSALAFITHIGRDEVIVRSLGTSGMIKKAEAYLAG